MMMTAACDNTCPVTVALLLTTEDTLSRPLPHVYQIEAESHQAIPIVVPEGVQQETNAAVGSGIGSISDVNVKDLRVIANQQVRLAAEVLDQACNMQQSFFYGLDLLAIFSHQNHVRLQDTSAAHRTKRCKLWL